MFAIGDPLIEIRRVSGLAGFGDPAIIEAQVRRPAFDFLQGAAHG
jgi:hypothetical protein